MHGFVFVAVQGGIIIGRNQCQTVFSVFHSVHALHIISDPSADYLYICSFVEHTFAESQFSDDLISQHYIIDIDNLRADFVRSLRHLRDGQNIVRYFSFHTPCIPFHHKIDHTAAFGQVYIGNTDHIMLSILKTGRIWLCDGRVSPSTILHIYYNTFEAICQ